MSIVLNWQPHGHWEKAERAVVMLKNGWELSCIRGPHTAGSEEDNTMEIGIINSYGYLVDDLDAVVINGSTYDVRNHGVLSWVPFEDVADIANWIEKQPAHISI